MKLRFRSSLFAALALIVALSSCKKDSEPALSDEEVNHQIIVHASDESQASLEMDQSLAEVSLFLDNKNEFAGDNLVLAYGPCDVDQPEYDVESNPMKITLTFNGDEECTPNRKRTGKIIVTLPKGTAWLEAGAVATITYQDFKVVRLSDQKIVTVNGTQTYTNVSGGRVWSIEGQDSVVRTLTSSNMSIKSDSAEVRTWNIAKKFTSKYDEQDAFFTKITGTHTEGNTSNIAEWGVNRFGRSFTTTIDVPVVYSMECVKNITGGKITHKTAIYSVTSTFGLNAQGVATGCPGYEGKYYFRVQATAGNRTFDELIAY